MRWTRDPGTDGRPSHAQPRYLRPSLLGPRDLRTEVEAWVRSMEEGYYPLVPYTPDPSLTTEVVRQIRVRLAEGSEWLRKFLFEHASMSIHSRPELHDELNAITRFHTASDYIRQLDE